MENQFIPMAGNLTVEVEPEHIDQAWKNAIDAGLLCSDCSFDQFINLETEFERIMRMHILSAKLSKLA